MVVSVGWRSFFVGLELRVQLSNASSGFICGEKAQLLFNILFSMLRVVADIGLALTDFFFILSSAFFLLMDLHVSISF